MATVIKASELREMVKESVRRFKAQQALNESAIEECSTNEEEGQMTKEELSEMIDLFVAEAFGEKGDSNGTHVGGTFGDGGKDKGPLEEGKKGKKKGLPPAFLKHKKKAADKEEGKKPASKKPAETKKK